MIKNMVIYGTLACISVFHTSCMRSSIQQQPEPFAAPTVVETTDDVSPAPCDDPLNYYNEVVTQTHDEHNAKAVNSLADNKETDACRKLAQAILLSKPGSKIQDDKQALKLLNELKYAETLSDWDLRFNNMLIQHITQRQDYVNLMVAQKKRLSKLEAQNTVLRNQLKTLQSQLDQLKNIEVEIDKKERSVTSPVSE